MPGWRSPESVMISRRMAVASASRAERAILIATERPSRPSSARNDDAHPSFADALDRPVDAEPGRPSSDIREIGGGGGMKRGCVGHDANDSNDDAKQIA